MLKNYIKVAIRSLKRQPAYTALNIIGLTVGITSSLLILLYIFHETSFDKFQSKSDRTYRISSAIQEPDNAFKWAVTQMPLGMTLKNENAEVEQYTRFFGGGRRRLEHNQINYFEENIYFVDSTVFKVLDFDFVAGDPNGALDAPNTVVLNKTIADKIFKGENPIGQTLNIDGNRSLEVTGVYRDYPDNSHIQPEGMISRSTFFGINAGSWGSFNLYTYVVLNENADADAFQAKLDSTIVRYVDPIFEPLKIYVKYELLPITTIHLNSDFQGEPVPPGDMDYIYIFSAIALFLVVIASINYMNLATARSMKRSLEVGIRKVMGANRGGLIWQFLTESILITLIALILSVLVLFLIVPGVNNVVGTNLDINALLETNTILATVLIVIFTGLIGGSYPAFFLSAFQPATVLKGNVGKSGGKILRKVLVTLQFTISIFMLIGTLVIYRQMEFVRNKDLGFDKEQMMSLQLNNRNTRQQWPVLRNKLLQNANINSAATTGSTPGSGVGKLLMLVESNEGVMEERGVDNYGVDYEFFPTMGIEFVAGRNFSLDFASDSASAVIVNEAMVERFGWEEPLGKRIILGGNDTIPPTRIVGVVKNFHQQSLHEEIPPLLFIPRRSNGGALIKINGNIRETVAFIKSTWEETFPTLPFEFEFLDEQFNEQYETDEVRGQLFLGFSFMTILIACLGLLGLASYTAEQRSKEISIRKVLGANTKGLVGLLIRDFIILVVIAAVPASILGYLSMQSWLENFQFHIEITAMIFATVLVGTIVITILTTGYHAMKSATANPAERLKYE